YEENAKKQVHRVVAQSRPRLEEANASCREKENDHAEDIQEEDSTIVLCSVIMSSVLGRVVQNENDATPPRDASENRVLQQQSYERSRRHSWQDKLTVRSELDRPRRFHYRLFPISHSVIMHRGHAGRY